MEEGEENTETDSSLLDYHCQLQFITALAIKKWVYVYGREIKKWESLNPRLDSMIQSVRKRRNLRLSRNDPTLVMVHRRAESLLCRFCRHQCDLLCPSFQWVPKDRTSPSNAPRLIHCFREKERAKTPVHDIDIISTCTNKERERERAVCLYRHSLISWPSTEENRQSTSSIWQSLSRLPDIKGG